jgi:uncharacterized membrane-anchored protein YjiN (DUF445 family)
MNKSLLTNLAAVSLIALGFLSPVLERQLLTTGYFALAGAVTNWIAVHMLFEKIPFIYGSGVIPTRFKEFKRGIRKLIMGQFFTRENIERCFRSSADDGGHGVDPRAILAAVDHEAISEGLIDVVKNSSFGGLLALVGGDSAFAPLRQPLMDRVKDVTRSVLQSERIADLLDKGFDASRLVDEVHAKVDTIVAARLDELTPQLVKEIVHEMMRTHLGWLVVWGGIFGGLIGLITSFVPV